MIPALSFMIGAYVIFRMVEAIIDRFQGEGFGGLDFVIIVMAIVVIGIAAVSLSDIFAGAKEAQNAQQLIDQVR